MNFDLANDFGNLFNRTVAMINKYFSGVIPVYKGSTGEFEQSLLEVNKTTINKYEEAMEKMEFSVALSAIWQLVSRTNKYIDETQAVAAGEGRRECVQACGCDDTFVRDITKNFNYVTAFFNSGTKTNFCTAWH